MDPDPTKNVVVFEIEGRRPFVSEGPTRDDGCIKRAWSKAPFLMRLAAGSVARIHSEWERFERRRRVHSAHLPEG